MRITSGQAIAVQADGTKAPLSPVVSKIYRQDGGADASVGSNGANGSGIFNYYPPFRQPDGMLETLDSSLRFRGVGNFLSLAIASGAAALETDPDFPATATEPEPGLRLVTYHPFV